jgi:phosphotransferase system HPr-like phosphotransfer protein
MLVVTYKAILKDENGLYVANSAKLVQSLSKFPGEFQLIYENNVYDMKSILGLISLAWFEKKLFKIRAALYYDTNISEVELVLSEHFELSNKTELKL